MNDDSGATSLSFLDVITNSLGSVLLLFFLMGARLPSDWRAAMPYLVLMGWGALLVAIYMPIDLQDRYVQFAFMFVLFPLAAMLRTSDVPRVGSGLCVPASVEVACIALAFVLLGQSLRDIAQARRLDNVSGQPGGAYSKEIYPAAAALRGVLLATSLVLALSGVQGTAAVAQVQEVLRQAWRASSLVECLNSVARMQQARHRRITPGLLALKRLYWNCRAFRTGRRRQQTPYGLLGVCLPTANWWELLRLSPEQLRQQLSGPRVAA